MTQPTIASAADYADALITARRAKGVLFLILLLFLLVQMTVFFLAAYTDLIFPQSIAAETPEAVEGEEPAGSATAPALDPAMDGEAAAAITQQTRAGDVLQYFTAGFNVLGIVLAIVMSLVLLVLLFILLAGRLMGVSQLTSAWIWSVVAAVLFFPWQAFHVIPLTAPVVEEQALQRWEFRLPGVLYTWSELAADGRFMHEDRPAQEAILKWARFVAYPAVVIVILLLVQTRSNRGLRRELGDHADMEPDESFHA